MLPFLAHKPRKHFPPNLHLFIPSISQRIIGSLPPPPFSSRALPRQALTLDRIDLSPKRPLEAHPAAKSSSSAPPPLTLIVVFSLFFLLVLLVSMMPTTTTTATRPPQLVPGHEGDAHDDQQDQQQVPGPPVAAAPEVRAAAVGEGEPVLQGQRPAGVDAPVGLPGPLAEVLAAEGVSV